MHQMPHTFADIFKLINFSKFEYIYLYYYTKSFYLKQNFYKISTHKVEHDTTENTPRKRRKIQKMLNPLSQLHVIEKDELKLTLMEFLKRKNFRSLLGDGIAYERDVDVAAEAVVRLTAGSQSEEEEEHNELIRSSGSALNYLWRLR